MAYYDRTVDTSTNPRDVRGWKYVVYKCDVCGNESEFTMVPNFQFRERPCKHCGAMGVEDHLNTLKNERLKILDEIDSLNSKLFSIEDKISKIESENEIKEILKEC